MGLGRAQRVDGLNGGGKEHGVALEARGMDPATATVRFLPPREQDGFDATAALLNEKQPPDAILTSNGSLAAGAFRALSQSKLHCPRDVAFASFDETVWAPMVTILSRPSRRWCCPARAHCASCFRTPRCAP